jgi:hypothetical protein
MKKLRRQSRSAGLGIRLNRPVRRWPRPAGEPQRGQRPQGRPPQADCLETVEKSLIRLIYRASELRFRRLMAAAAVTVDALQSPVYRAGAAQVGLTAGASAAQDSGGKHPGTVRAHRRQANEVAGRT